MLKKGTFKGMVKQKDGKLVKVKIDEVYYVPNIATNLFSITKALSSNAKISSQGETIEIKKNNWKLNFERKINSKNGYVPGVEIIPEYKIETTSTKDASYATVHAILIHTSEEITKNTASYLGIKVRDENQEPCLSCAVRKTKQKGIKKNSENIENPGDLFSLDISSCKNKAYGGAKFWLLVVDHATNMKWPFFLKHKSQKL